MVLIKGKKLEREPKFQNNCLEILTHGENQREARVKHIPCFLVEVKINASETEKSCLCKTKELGE